MTRTLDGLFIGVEPSRARATDIPYLVADVDEVHGELGWEARIPQAQITKKMLGTA